ncbi:MAG: hypothetical protein M3Y87_23250, partial [Myxococcota bacterium]|nr:hypothetical protein [Myxococcota bacterium]
DAIGGPCEPTCFGPDRLCIDGRCAAIERRRDAVAGEQCGLIAAPGGMVDERCEEGVACSSSSSPRGPVCVATAAEGDPCGPAAPCAGPLVCAERTATGGRCRAITRATETGAACAGHPDGAITAVCDPRAGLVCTSDDDRPGTCVR